MITIHMIIALLIVLLLIYINFRIRMPIDYKSAAIQNKTLGYLSILCLVTLAVQIVLGTQVRESIDMISASLDYNFRNSWVNQLGLDFYIHRSFSLLILALHIWLLVVVLRNNHQSSRVKAMGKYVVLLIVLEIFTGIIMAYFGMPPFMQPIHLLLSTVIFGALYYMSLLIKNEDKTYAPS